MAPRGLHGGYAGAARPAVKRASRSDVSDSATPWAVALQVPLSMGFSRQEYWGGLPCLSPGDLPNPGIESRSPTLQADSLLFELPRKPHASRGHWPTGHNHAVNKQVFDRHLLSICYSRCWGAKQTKVLSSLSLYLI